MPRDRPFTIDFQVPANGRLRRASVQVLDGDGDVLFADKADLMDARERAKLADRIAGRLKEEPAAVAEKLEAGWNEVLTDRAQSEAEADDQAEAETELPDDCLWKGVQPPRGYRLSADGCVQELGDDGPRPLTRGPVWVEAFARDYRFDGWGSLLVWRDRDGQTHRAAFPAGRFHEQSLSLVQELAGGGPMERAGEQLRAFLLRNEARFRDRDNADQVVRDLAGYRDRERGLFLLTQEGAKEALEGHSVQDVMRHLLAVGWLEANEPDRLLSQHRIRGIERKVRLYAVRAARRRG